MSAPPVMDDPKEIEVRVDVSIFFNKLSQPFEEKKPEAAAGK